MGSLAIFVGVCSVFVMVFPSASARINHLKIRDCMNASRETGHLESLTVFPYPPQLPGNITVSASIRLFRPLSGNIRIELDFRRKWGILGYAFKIPCIKNFGSCNYTDVCAMIRGDKTTTAATNNPISLTDHPGSTTDKPAATEPPTSASTHFSSGTPVHTVTDHVTSFAPTLPSEVTWDDHISGVPGGHRVLVGRGVAATNEDQPPTTTATAEAVTDTDVPFTQIVTDVSSEPATTSFVQAVSGVTDGDACPDLLAKNNLPCRCPFNAGLYKLPPTTFVLPDLGTLSALAKGDYKVKAMFYDDDTGKRLACQVIETSISDGGPEEPCTGPDCIIG